MKAPPGYGGNGAGDGGSGGGGGDGGTPSSAPKANAQFPDMDHVNLSRLFGDKIALSDSYSFDGVKGGDAWRKKAGGYWISKCPELKPILDYSEGMCNQVFTDDALVAEAAPTVA